MANTCKGAYPCMEGYNCVDGIAGSFCLNPCESIDACFLMARCLEVVVQQCECWLRHGSEKAMNEFNGNPDFPGNQTERKNA